MPRMTKGRLYKAGKKNCYHLQYYVKGKQFVVTLKDDHGEPITREDKARIAADKILHPVIATNRAEQLRQLRNAAESAEQKAERLTQEQESNRKEAADRQKDQRASIARGWQLFMECPSRPESCKGFTYANVPPHTAAASYKSHYGRFAKWMQEHHSDIPSLADVTAEHVSAFTEELHGLVAAGTFNKIVSFGKLFYNTLLEDGKIRVVTNPFLKIKRQTNRSNKHEALTVEEIGRLLSTATGEMRLLIAFGYFLGLRFGDACTLKWGEVDMIRRVVERIPRKTAHTSGAAVRLGIPRFLFNMLAEVPEPDRRGYILPDCAARYDGGHAPQLNREVLNLFTQCEIETREAGTGSNSHYEGTRKVYEPGRARAVVKRGFHSLRFSFVSHNLDAGAPATYVQSAAGHANPQMTEHYAQVGDSALQKYAGNLTIPAGLLAHEGGDVIDIIPLGNTDVEPERNELRQLADSLKIEAIRELLQHIRRVKNG